MTGDSYTLREVAELLGVSKRTLQRRIREGAFPHRFLAPGRHGLETRIPREDVHRALDDLRRGDPVPTEHRTQVARRIETVTPEAYAESLVPYQPEAESRALTRTDLEALRDATLAIVREERHQLITAVRDALSSRDQEIGALRAQMSDVQHAVERLRQKLETHEPAARPVPPRRGADPRPTHPDLVEGLLEELEELEALVGGFEN